MTEQGKTNCPECGAGNGPGAPFCAACGLTLRQPGLAGRDDDDEEEEERRPMKKPGRADDAVQKGAPLKKKPRPIDEEDEEDQAPRRPVKKKVSRRDEEEDDEPQSLRDNTLLNMLAPVGGSVWGLAAFAFGFIGAAIPIVLAVLWWLHNAQTWLGKIGYAIAGLGILISLLTLPLGGLSFIFRPKGNYGGIMSYMRAIVGILLGFLGVILTIVFCVKPMYLGDIFGR